MNTAKLTTDDLVLVGEGNGAAMVRVGNISSLEVEGNYLTVRRNGGEAVMTRASLAHCMERLPATFFHAGRQFVINLAEVAKVNMVSRTILVTMKDGTKVQVSRLRSRAFRKELAL